MKEDTEVTGVRKLFGKAVPVWCACNSYKCDDNYWTRLYCIFLYTVHLMRSAYLLEMFKCLIYLNIVLLYAKRFKLFWGGKRKERHQYNFSHLSCSFSLQWNWGSRGSCWSLPPRKRTRRRRSVAPSSCARQSFAPSRWRRPPITDLCAEPSTAVTKHRVSITLSFLHLCGLNIRTEKGEMI